jgi:hypothetical protein
MQPPLVVVQVCPRRLLHAPAPSQVPGQRPLGSSRPVTATHAWLAEQAWQEPGQSLSRQQPPVAMHEVDPPLVQACVPDGQP